MTHTLYPVKDRWELRFERHLAHPPATVWRALTQPEHLSQWYPMTATEIDPRVGGTIRFLDEEGVELRAQITEVLAPRVLAFNEYDEQTGTHGPRFELEPDGSGCRLVFTHTFADKTWAERTAAGWTDCLKALTQELEEFA